MSKFYLIYLIFFSFNVFAAENYGDIIGKYNINGEDYIITQEATYQELWKLNPETKQKISIKRVFSFESFAQECKMLNEKPIFFASVKEYYFAGGWVEPKYLTIFDLNGKKIGIAPSLKYADRLCKFG